MTLVQLKHFVTLAELGSYVSASKALFLTQPALSRSIQLLEEELGQPLFDRIGRRIDITPFGIQTLRHAQHLVQDAESLRNMGKRAQTGKEGRVRVGLSSGPGAVLSVPLLKHMALHHPKMQIEISRGNTDRLLDALRERELDGAIVDIRAMRPAEDLVVAHQVEMSAAFLVRAGHPLLKRKTALSIEEVLAYPLASTPLSDEVARMLTERYGPKANPDDCVTLRCDDTQALIDVAAQSDAVVLTILAAARQLKPLRISPAMQSTARFGLVTLNRRAQAPGLAVVSRVMDLVLRDAEALIGD